MALSSAPLSGAMERTADSPLPSFSKEVEGRLQMIPSFTRMRDSFANPSCLHHPNRPHQLQGHSGLENKEHKRLKRKAAVLTAMSICAFCF